MRKLRGNGERMRKLFKPFMRKPFPHFLSISSSFPHSLSISSFSFHFLILCFFPHSLSISSFSVHFLSISSFSLHFLILSPFPLNFLILSPFPRSPAARLQQVAQPWLTIDIWKHNKKCSHLILKITVKTGSFGTQSPNLIKEYRKSNKKIGEDQKNSKDLNCQINYSFFFL